MGSISMEGMWGPNLYIPIFLENEHPFASFDELGF
jgi:hypothetical protein